MILAGGVVALFFLLWGLLHVAGPLIRPVLPALAHRTAAFRYHDFLPVFILLAVGLALVMLTGDGFIDLAERVYEQNPHLEAIDRDVHDWAVSERTPGATHFFLVATTAGDPLVLTVIIGAAAFVLARTRRWRWLAYLMATTGIGALLNLELKRFFARSRPDLAEALRHASGYSFPSGHAMGSTIVFGALGYLSYRYLTRWRNQSAAIALAMTLIVSVSASRIYLGVHWGSDVGAGISAGMLWLTVTTVAYETFRRIRMIRALRTRRTGTAPPAS